MEENLTEHKNILLEVYKQESENLRFFEDLLLKIHFFVFTGMVFIFSYIYKNNNEYLSIFKTSKFFLLICLVVVIFLIIDLEYKRKKRMYRLSKIVGKLGLIRCGVFKEYNKIWFKNGSTVIVLVYVVVCIFLMTDVWLI